MAFPGGGVAAAVVADGDGGWRGRGRVAADAGDILVVHAGFRRTGVIRSAERLDQPRAMGGESASSGIILDSRGNRAAGGIGPVAPANGTDEKGGGSDTAGVGREHSGPAPQRRSHLAA